MGMFDTVHFECPHCGQNVELQTKAGPCQLNEYQLSEVTGAIAEDFVQHDGCRYEYKVCYRCGGSIEFEAKVIVQISVRKPD